ncbi:MAG: hypothetical protein IJM30_04435 [Thermoguttaceae bacterium]|nr:hypothetical protein [Thermoguttaceae bacterium]
MRTNRSQRTKGLFDNLFASRRENKAPRTRRLFAESLEDRRLLSATPNDPSGSAGVGESAPFDFQTALVGDYANLESSSTSEIESVSALFSVGATPENLGALPTPTIDALSGTKSAIVIKFNEFVEGAEKYVVEYSTDSSFATGVVSKSYSSAGSKTISGVSSDAWYYVRVKATATGSADSAYSTSRKIYTNAAALQVPAVQISAVKTSIVVKINEAELATGYVLEYDVDPNFSAPKTKNYASAGVKTISGLTFATRYYFRVKAISDVRNDSRWNEFNYAAGQLSTPSRFASSVGSDFVKVKCYNSASASGFEVEYSTDPNFSNSQRATGPASGLVEVTGLQLGTKYYFRARALGDNVSRVDSNWSPSFSATPKESPSTPAPRQLATPTVTSSASLTEVVVNISEVPGAVNYVLEYSSFSHFGTHTQRTYSYPGRITISGFKSGTVYYFRVKAVGIGIADSEWNVFSQKTTGLVPPNVSASVTKTAVVLNIGAVEGATGYVVHCGLTYQMPTYIEKTYSTSGVKTISGLNPGTTYYFRIKAVSTNSGESDWTRVTAKTNNGSTSAALDLDAAFEDYFDDQEDFWNVLVESRTE